MGHSFALVLHTHLPMVINHGRWPHGSDWLTEATFECYLPLLETMQRLVAGGVSPKWTINVSPVLAEQLASPEFQRELAFYADNLRRTCADSRAHFDRQGDRAIVALTGFWEQFYDRMWELHRRINGDIPGALAELQRGGHIELITCAATHGYLPARNRSISSSALRSRLIAVTSACRPAVSGCPSAPTARATNGRRRPGATAGASGACGRASRKCSRSTGSSTSSPTITPSRAASRSTPTGISSGCRATSRSRRPRC